MTLTWCHRSLFWTYAIPKTWAQKKNKHQMGQSLHCRKSSLLCSSNSIQQQSHIKFVWTTTMRVWTLHMRVCCVPYMVRVRVCRCVRICVLLRWNPAFQLLFVLLCLLLLPNHVACITRSVELSSSLRSGSHRTTAVARQVCVDQYFLTIRVLT